MFVIDAAVLAQNSENWLQKKGTNVYS